MADFATPFTSGVLARIVFDWDDEDQVARAVAAVQKVAIGGAEGILEMSLLAAEYLDQRERSDDRRDDIVDALLAARVDGGRPLTDEERLGAITLLFLAGLDTSRAALGNVFAALAEDPELETRLRDPRWVRADMDELLRFYTPVAAIARKVTRPTVLGGIPLAPGDRVLVHLGRANRDADKFVDPDVLAFDRPQPGNTAFGLGVHRCMGSHVARIELAIAVEEILARVGRIRLDGCEVVDRETGIVSTPRTLPLAFDRVG